MLRRGCCRRKNPWKGQIGQEFGILSPLAWRNDAYVEGGALTCQAHMDGPFCLKTHANIVRGCPHHIFFERHVSADKAELLPIQRVDQHCCAIEFVQIYTYTCGFPAGAFFCCLVKNPCFPSRRHFFCETTLLHVDHCRRSLAKSKQQFHSSKRQSKRQLF